MEKTILSETEFTEVLIGKLKETAGEGYSVSLHSKVRNNGQTQYGIVIRPDNGEIAPFFHRDLMFMKYREGLSVNEIAAAVWKFFREEIGKKQFDVRDFMEWDRVKDHLTIRALSTEMNSSMLEQTVHREVLDLSAVVYAKMEKPAGDGVGYIMVLKEHLQLWGKSEADVYETAMEHTVRENISFASINENIKRILSEKKMDLIFDGDLIETDIPLYVLTNETNQFGAVYMLLPEVMERIAAEKGEDLYLIPSSIHETLVMPASSVDDPLCLQFTLLSVNKMQLPLEDRLSNHVYRYRKGAGLEIAL